MWGTSSGSLRGWCSYGCSCLWRRHCLASQCWRYYLQLGYWTWRHPYVFAFGGRGEWPPLSSRLSLWELGVESSCRSWCFRGWSLGSSLRRWLPTQVSRRTCSCELGQDQSIHLGTACKLRSTGWPYGWSIYALCLLLSFTSRRLLCSLYYSWVHQLPLRTLYS